MTSDDDEGGSVRSGTLKAYIPNNQKCINYSHRSGMALAITIDQSLGNIP